MKQTQAISKETLSTIYGGDKHSQCQMVKIAATAVSFHFAQVAYSKCMFG
ncbi:MULTISPECIES: hypothetical protein [unclassified Streptococcus]|nr:MULTISPECIES: hypothetical protein [unclassified Streptococcus]MBF8969486.1 hypothetical protein [Streptococcus sp. NLN76]MBG9368142.1 hypothetical protein [Streptococcus sp. NLN64]